MDPSTLLDVPSFAGTGHPQQQEVQSFAWGHKVEYKSLSLDTLPDNRAPQTSTRRFRADDTRNTLTRYDEVQGTKSNPLPYCRVQHTGYHDTKLFPTEPYVKQEVEKAWCRPGPTKPPRQMSSLTTADIEGAKAFTKANEKFSRHTDPVQPVYQLPSFAPVPIPELKFLRDSIPCEDITADPRKKLFVSTPRESTSLKVSDISGTTSRQLHRERKGLYTAGLGVKPQPIDQLQVADIAYETKKLPYHFKETERHTNPLEPQYRYNVPSETWINSRLTGEQPKAVTQKVKDDWYIGPVSDKYSLRFSTGAPLKWTPGLNGDITYREYMLRTEDIDGTHTNTKGRIGRNRTTAFYRTQAGRSNYVDDVEGAHPKGPFTLLPGHILTKRVLAEKTKTPQLHFPATTALLNATQPGATPRGSGAGATPRSARLPSAAAAASPRAAATPRTEAAVAAKAPTPRDSAAQKASAGTPRSVQATPRASQQATPRSAAGSQKGAMNKQLLAALTG